MRLCETILGITRRCNMVCRHCVKGEAQPVNIDSRIIPKLFDECEWIRRLCITGGEPTLNLASFCQIIEQMKMGKCKIGSVFLITNGKRFVREACELFQEMVSLCVDNRMTEFVVGATNYHKGTEEGSRQYMEWKRQNDASWLMWKKVGTDDNRWLVNDGLAKKNGIGTLSIDNRARAGFELWQDEVRLLFISSFGDVLSWCDLSYDSMPIYSKGNMLRRSFADIVKENMR